MAGILTHRLARRDDVAVLKPLMEAAIGQLQKPFLPPEPVAASFSIMGFDTQLIGDGTYFVIECGRVTAVCGGWSRRATLFGGEHSAERDAALLDPARDAPGVRAMYMHPDFTRRGAGQLVLALCEEAVARHGFGRVELAATLAGEPLYRARHYSDIEAFVSQTPSGVRVPMIRMGKRIGEVRRANSNEAPKANIIAPDAWPRICVSFGRRRMAARVRDAASATAISARLFNKTLNVPNTTNYQAAPYEGSINWGVNAMTNAAVLGLITPAATCTRPPTAVPAMDRIPL